MFFRMSSEQPNNRMNPMYTCEKITSLLLNNPDEFSVVLNERTDRKATFWEFMGYPAKRNLSGVQERIEGFVSCRHCFKTYVQNKSTGTTHLHRHKCASTKKSTPLINALSLKQISIKNAWANIDIKSIKLTTRENDRIKQLCSKWICENIRPFSVMKDSGLRHLVQECVQLGK